MIAGVVKVFSVGIENSFEGLESLSFLQKGNKAY